MTSPSFSLKELKKIEALEKIYGRFFSSHVERRAYRCPSCNKIEVREWFKIQFWDLIEYSGSFRCGKCRVKLEDITSLIDPDIEESEIPLNSDKNSNTKVKKRKNL